MTMSAAVSCDYTHFLPTSERTRMQLSTDAFWLGINQLQWYTLNTPCSNCTNTGWRVWKIGLKSRKSNSSRHIEMYQHHLDVIPVTSLGHDSAHQSFLTGLHPLVRQLHVVDSVSATQSATEWKGWERRLEGKH